MESYTFHVSIPNTGRVWRKVELTAEQTLEDLHFAIQNAFDFDADHLYSFFMSGRAWDSATEYTLPEGADPWDEDLDGDFEDEDLLDEDEDDEDFLDEEGEGEGLEDGELFEDDLDDEIDFAEGADLLGPEVAQALKAALGDKPAPASFEEMLGMVKENDALRTEMVKMMVAQTGIPASLADLFFRNADKLHALPAEEFAQQMWAIAPEELRSDLVSSYLFDDAPPAGDVRTTTLAQLGLAKGKTFLYIFDYGDDWRFKVRVHAINPDADTTLQYPRLVEEVGDAPLQYGGWDDEEEEE